MRWRGQPLRMDDLSRRGGCNDGRPFAQTSWSIKVKEPWLVVASDGMNEDAFSKDKTRSPRGKLRGRCPACGATVTLSDAAEVWDIVDCHECTTMLEIVELRPPTLDYAHDDARDQEWGEETEDSW